MTMSNRYEGGDLLVESLENLGVGQVLSVSGGVIDSIYRAAAAHGLGARLGDADARIAPQDHAKVLSLAGGVRKAEVDRSRPGALVGDP